MPKPRFKVIYIIFELNQKDRLGLGVINQERPRSAQTLYFNFIKLLCK